MHDQAVQVHPSPIGWDAWAGRPCYVAGRALGEGIMIWERSRLAPKGSSAIAPQFEFNRHMRAYFKANPGRTHADAVKAWKAAKAKRGQRREDDV